MTTINNYPILNQNYLQSSQTACAPAFRGGVDSNSLTTQALQPVQNPQTTNPQTPPSLSYPPDTVEISPENKIKTQTKEKMSTGAKVGLTVAGGLATIYGCVVGHRMLNKPSIEKVAKNFSDIFRRDVSVEDAKKMTEKYKEIFKEDDVEKFCKNLFEQAKKDYGFENANIKLKIEKLPNSSLSTISTKQEIGSYNPRDGILTLYPIHSSRGVMTTMDKNQMLETVLHELQHAKQSEYAYRTNTTKYIDALQARANGKGKSIADELIKDIETKLSSKCDLKRYMKENGFKTMEEAEKKLKHLIKVAKEKKEEVDKLKSPFDKNKQLEDLKSIWGNLESFKTGSKEYELGMKYIDNEAHYINANKYNYDQYRAQLLEKEAFGIEPKVQEIFNSFANPWRIF